MPKSARILPLECSMNDIRCENKNLAWYDFLYYISTEVLLWLPPYLRTRSRIGVCLNKTMRTFVTLGFEPTWVL